MFSLLVGAGVLILAMFASALLDPEARQSSLTMDARMLPR